MWNMLRSGTLPVLLLIAMSCGIQPQAVAGMEEATFVVT